MDTCILSVFHNPTNCEKKIKNFNEFIEKIKSLGLEENLYVCELSEKKISQFKEIKNLFFLQIKNNLSYNECAINFLLKNIPEYKKIIIADYEIRLVTNNNWIEIISNALNDNCMIQPFKKIILNKEKDKIELTGAVSGIKETNKIKTNYFFGGITGYNYEYLKFTKGLFDKCLLGEGEIINTIPFFYECYIKLKFLKSVCVDTQLEVLNYIEKARTFIKENKSKCGFLNLNAEHLNYKKYNNKFFNTINKNNFYEIFYENKNNFYEPLDENIEKQYIKKIKYSEDGEPEIRIFDYRKRKESCKENKIIWLSDNNTILFKNIKKIKLYFKKEKNLSYFRIISDWEEINSDFSNKEFCVEIKKPKSIIIISDFYIPKNISEGNDVRKLSVYLYKVEIADNKNYKNYPIEKIIIEKYGKT